MIISMRWIYALLIFCRAKTNFAYVKLFNTENALDVHSYDCIYYTNVTAGNNETTSYCIRRKESVQLNRSFSTHTCENSGKEWSFRSLKEMNVSEDEVLRWNSSIEMADRYAAYLTTGHKQFDNDKICNCSPITFGKFCEYEFMTMNTFEDTIQYQFDLKMNYRNGSQLWGNITCYTTLTNCYFGLQCISWQNICDGKQQCMDGIDEDGCEELEYNECEDNEYRCRDGSCIAEEFWLDAQYDCSDKSDEQEGISDVDGGTLCPIISSRFDCDEATQGTTYFACGDGQFESESPNKQSFCYNYRSTLFFCEIPMYMSILYPKWTLDNGHCVDKGWIDRNLTGKNESEKCIVYLKCILSDGAGVGCDDIIYQLHSLCKNKRINYPSGPIFTSYIQAVYQLSEMEFSWTNYILFNGSLKCVGYQARSGPQEMLFERELRRDYAFDTFFCMNSTTKDISGLQFDKNCWNDTKQSFHCQKSPQCISKHHLRNGIKDCFFGEDEDSSQRCYVKNQHRFNCSGKQPLCLLVSEVGDGTSHCNGGIDEYIIQLMWNLEERKCRTPNSIECNILKAYIKSPSTMRTAGNNKVPVFRQYCDSLWQLSRGFDESLCKEWKCPRDEYQCLSGHCIPTTETFSGYFEDWNCPDASDAIGLLRIAQLSEHNVRLMSRSELELNKDIFARHNNDSYEVAFTKYCKSTKEYGCILANVTDPLNFTINRPCIDLVQIGDGIIDCYGGLDERNLLTCGNNVFEQRGFNFHCNDQECIPYDRQCEQRCTNNADSLLCDQLKTLWNSFCPYPTRYVYCEHASKQDCDLYQTSRYYCSKHLPCK